MNKILSKLYFSLLFLTLWFFATGLARTGQNFFIRAYRSFCSADGSASSFAHTLISSSAAEEYCLPLGRVRSEELQILPGLGKVRARRILEYWHRPTTLDQWEKLATIPSIGPRLLQNWKPYFCWNSRHPHAYSQGSGE
ncbi:MAG: hypothetical protein D6805_05450 [Planctomycetota bacterium]|nr:MAG: hypothetical protein D6805_05450 [Planctomycetota bacterium]